MLDFLYNILALILPESGLRKIGKAYNWIYLNTIVRILIPYVKYHHKREIKRIKKKEKIKVAFLVIHLNSWKLEKIYFKLKQSDRFEPVIIVCPDTKRGIKYMSDEIQKNLDFFQKNNYEVYSTLNLTKQTWVNIESEINPDIIFFINPHDLSRKEYSVHNFLKKLTCYIPYSVRNDHLSGLAFNSPFQQLVWKNFYETHFHKKIAQEIALNKGENVEVTGYPTFEEFFLKRPLLKRPKKKIIWAPHWTIEKNNFLNKSCFLMYSQFFISFFNQYADKVEIILRPHPFLKYTLNNSALWGKEKTEAYFKIWETTPGLMVHDGPYSKLFIESDLLIHDSVSFLTEYLATGNPAIYTKRPLDIDPPMNEFGKRCLQAHYIIDNEEELESRLVKILFNNQDEKQKERQTFISSFIKPYSNASGKIVEILNHYAG
jgi:hypothetical protein